MTNSTNDRKDLQPQDGQKQEVAPFEGTERTYTQKAYVPQVDIYETDEALLLLADMPGVDETSVDITLEKNILSIDGHVSFEPPDNYNLTYTEYDIGDYQRRFTLTEGIDQENIEATVKDGVLRLHLPKAGPVKAKQITIKAG